jgi:malonyl-CoA/methylmalonyl-CoA synthetase
MDHTVLSLWERVAQTEGATVRDKAGVHSRASVALGARRIAAALLGERASLDGDRVAIFVEPSVAFVHALLGVLGAGGTLTVLSPLHTANESNFLLGDCGAIALIVSNEMSARAVELAPDLRRVPASLGADEAAKERAFVARNATDDALQLYTSGTTGKPKGAILSHGNLAVQMQLLAGAWGWSESDVLLHALPLHHMHGLVIALMTALGAGACTHLMPFDAPALLRAMHEATVFMAVPTMYQKLLAALDAASPDERAHFERGASHLRLSTSGSAALPVTFGERWRSITGAYPLERFGMTEIGVGLTTPLVGERRPGHVGFPLPSVETRIVDERGQDAEVGELWVRGPSVFERYHARPAETAASFVAAGASERPWFRTGDTVTRSEPDGAFKILGRSSVDIIKSGGYKLSALEIEEALREHPAVAEVAVIGLPDEVWGERVVACVVPRPGQDAACNEAAIRAHARSLLASYKVPKEVHVLGELPKNQLGKVIKPTLTASLTSESLPPR